MARPQVLPNIDRVIELRNHGLTQQQIADKVNEENRKIQGVDFRPVTRSAVSVALIRAGEKGGQRPRYYDEIPWSPIRPEHYNDYRQTQLRTWARVNRGDKTIPCKMLHEFELFAKKLEEHNAVIHYDPKEGFIAVSRRPGIDTGLIRLTPKQIKERGLEAKLEELGLKPEK